MAAKTINFAGGNNVTVSTATAANVTTITISGPNTHAVETPLSVGVSTGGNTAGNTTVNTGSRLVLSGQANITLSQVTGAGATTIGISGGAGGGVNFSGGISTGGNTAGSTGITGTRLVLVGTNAVSLSQATDANGGTVSFDVTNTTHGHTNLSAGVSTGGNTSGTTGVNTGSQLVLVGGNNITASQGTAAGATTITLSGPNTHAQQTGISGIQNTETTYISGTVELEGTNNITVFSTTGQRFRISGANTHAAETPLSVGISTGGNTEGNTTVNTGSRLVFVGSNMITLSQATAAGASTITLKATQSVQTQDVLSAGVSTGGNTAGNTGVNTGSQLVFSGQANITLSQATAAGATTIGISGAGGAGGNFSGGVSNLGNTAGSTAITGTQNVHVGTHHLTLSQSTGANGATITYIPGPNINIWNNFRPHGTVQGIQTAVNDGLDRTWGIFPLMHNEPFPGLMTVNTLFMKLSVSGSTATMSAAATSSFSFALYTLTGSSLSLLNSASTSFGYAAAASNNSTGWAGIRWLTLHSSLWSVQPVLSQAEYWIGTAYATSGVSNQTLNLYGMRAHASQSVSHSGTLGVATVAGATSHGYGGFWPGLYTATSASPPGSIGSAELSRSVMVQVPYLVLQRDGPQTF